jgi:hypothetical protein
VRKAIVRLIGCGMTCVAAITFIMVLTIAERPVAASSCCAQCEANETACYAACDQVSDGDERTACQNKCYHDLYERPGACFAHCSFCDSGGTSWACYSCTWTTHYDGGQVWQSVDCTNVDMYNSEVDSHCSIW